MIAGESGATRLGAVLKIAMDQIGLHGLEIAMERIGLQIGMIDRLLHKRYNPCAADVL